MYGMKVVGSSDAHRVQAAVEDDRSNNSNSANIRSLLQKRSFASLNCVCACLLLLWVLTFSIGAASLIKIVLYEQEFGTTNEIIRSAREEFININKKQHWFELNFIDLFNITTATNQNFRTIMSALFQASSVRDQSRETSFTGSWDDAKTRCDNERLQLCSQQEIFPKDVRSGVRVLLKGKPAWIPVRDTYNDWVLVGAKHHPETGVIHNNRNLAKVAWNKKPSLPSSYRNIKLHVLCCYPMPN